MTYLVGPNVCKDLWFGAWRQLPKVGLVLFTLAGLVPAVFAQRPSAPRLLPDDTLAYVRVENVPELVERFQETSMGRITSDEQVQPFVGHLYQSALNAFSQIEERVGLSLGELLEIPQGELCVAIVAPDEGRPELVLLADVGDHVVLAEKLLERMDD